MKVSRKHEELFLVIYATVKARHSQALCNTFARPVQAALTAPSLRKAIVFNNKPMLANWWPHRVPISHFQPYVLLNSQAQRPKVMMP